LLDQLNPRIAKLTQAIEEEVKRYPAAQRLRTHLGVGPLTALAFVLIIGQADRFQCGKQIASYLGLVPLEKSSGNQRRLGHITKQGNSLLRYSERRLLATVVREHNVVEGSRLSSRGM
jgi:transposase